MHDHQLRIMNNPGGNCTCFLDLVRVCPYSYSIAALLAYLITVTPGYHMLNLILTAGKESWSLLLESSVFVLIGILLSGGLKVFLHPATVAKHLGSGRFSSVVKAALLGVPLPLCSCGVLPAATALRKQGANKGAVTAFLISTPESGIDSITVSYALLDPIMTVARPIAAFITAILAGFVENSCNWPTATAAASNTGLANNRRTEPEGNTVSRWTWTTTVAGLKYAVIDVWGDIALWFFSGILIAGMIMALIPDEFLSTWLNGGISSMLVMLVVGVPLYICATASTPVAAALILKGVSPGAALVFLLVGPATNITSLSVLTGILGKKNTFRYLVILSSCALLFGLGVDQIYTLAGISPRAVIGEASEVLPYGMKLAGTIILILLSLRPFFCRLQPKPEDKCSAHTFQSGFPALPTDKKNR